VPDLDPYFRTIEHVTTPIGLVAFLAMVGLRVFYVFVKEGKGLDFAFRLFQDKLGKQHFDQLATMIVGRAFWLMLVVTVLSFVAWGYGLYLNRPTASQADFSLTVYVHSPGDMMRWPLVNEGEVVLRLGPDTRRAPIGNEGRAFFPALSGTFRGQEVEVKVLPETFELTDGGHAMLTPPSLSLAVRRKDFTFRGHVQESGRKGEAVKDARVEIAGAQESRRDKNLQGVEANDWRNRGQGAYAWSQPGHAGLTGTRPGDPDVLIRQIDRAAARRYVAATPP